MAPISNRGSTEKGEHARLNQTGRLVIAALAAAMTACAPLLPLLPVPEFHTARDGPAPCATFPAPTRQGGCRRRRRRRNVGTGSRLRAFARKPLARGFVGDALGPRAIEEWITRLARLVEEGYAVEIGTLPAADRARLDATARTQTGQTWARAALVACTAVLA
ncbi:MAG: hypothetical protein RL398_277 [Planctomycetota bacterium]|jgi:hypothetical protein